MQILRKSLLPSAALFVVIMIANIVRNLTPGVVVPLRLYLLDPVFWIEMLTVSGTTYLVLRRS